MNVPEDVSNDELGEAVDAGPPPREVTNEEVMVFAKRQCKYCTGTGMLVKLYHVDKTEENPKGEMRVPRVCMCASERFMKKHRNDLRVINNVAYWKDDE